MKLAGCLFALALPLCAESGSLTIHMILHAIGQERYEFVSCDDHLDPQQHV